MINSGLETPPKNKVTRICLYVMATGQGEGSFQLQYVVKHIDQAVYDLENSEKAAITANLMMLMLMMRYKKWSWGTT